MMLWGAETVGEAGQTGLLENIKNMYVDFFTFTLKGNAHKTEEKVRLTG